MRTAAMLGVAAAALGVLAIASTSSAKSKKKTEPVPPKPVPPRPLPPIPGPPIPPVPGPVPPVATVFAKPLNPDGTYTVVAGDYGVGIAKKLNKNDPTGATWKELRSLNPQIAGRKDPKNTGFVIFPGDVLNIPESWMAQHVSRFPGTVSPGTLPGPSTGAPGTLPGPSTGAPGTLPGPSTGAPGTLPGPGPVVSPGLPTLPGPSTGAPSTLPNPAGKPPVRITDPSQILAALADGGYISVHLEDGSWWYESPSTGKAVGPYAAPIPVGIVPTGTDAWGIYDVLRQSVTYYDSQGNPVA